MELRVYHSLEDVYLKNDDFLQNCVPLSKGFNLEVVIKTAPVGIMKKGLHRDAAFTCKGDFADHYALIVIMPKAEPLRLNSRFISEPTILLTPPNWEYSVQFPHIYQDYLILWHKDLFEKKLAQNKLFDLMKDSQTAITWGHSKTADRFLTNIRMLFFHEKEKMEKQMDEALDFFIEFVISNKPKRMRSRPSRKTAYDAFDLLKDNHNKGINIAEACEILNTSRRTLELSYKKYFGVSPGQHLKVMKLFNIRKHLIESPNDSKVSEILQSQNIAHMGHFGVSYKELFQENMKQTLKYSGL